MDHLRTHYDPEALRLIEACGATIKFLPPCSPDFTPIEKMWSRIKTLLRRLGARTQDELSAAISRAFAQVTPQDAAGWFSSCHITASQS